MDELSFGFLVAHNASSNIPDILPTVPDILPTVPDMSALPRCLVRKHPATSLADSLFPTSLYQE
jgi:hypothetical protein